MGSIKRIIATSSLGLLGLCLVALCHRAAARFSTAVAPHPSRALPAAPPPRNAFEVALRRAQQCRTRAKLAVSRERDGLEAWDPRASEEINADDWRLQRLADDPGGNLHQAQVWVRQAAALARTAGEAYRAAELQVLLDHEMGDHEAEFREAQRLVALAPGSERARMVWERAAACHRRISHRLISTSAAVAR